MKTIETLLWILDKFDNNGKMMFDDDKIQQNIDFVHSLGLKCDSVGWNKLSLQSKQADEILTSIEVFCKESGFKARGYYSKSYTDYTSDWFVLEPGTFKDNTLCDYVEYENDQGERIGGSRTKENTKPSSTFICLAIVKFLLSLFAEAVKSCLTAKQ